MLSEWKSLDPRPAKGGWAPGDYISPCYHCECQFMGDKGARQCADCAYREPDVHLPEPQKKKPRTVTFKVDVGHLFDAVRKNGIEKVAARVIGVLLGQSSFAEALGLSLYGIEIVEEKSE